MAEQWWEDAPLVEDNPAPASNTEEQWWASAPVVEPAAPQEESGAMSILGRSLMRGTADAITGVGQSGQFLTQGADSLKPQVGPSDDPELDRLLKQSVGEGWTDPNWWIANTMTPLAGSSPTLAGAIGGAGLGAATTRNPYGAAVGGAAGGAAAAVMQTLGPSYVQALQDGLSPDDAFERAWTQAGVSGAFSAVAGALPMAAMFGRTAEGALKAPIKEALLQMFVAQPGVGVAEQVVQTGIEGREVTADDLAKAYIGEAVAGGVLDVGANLATGGYRPGTVAERGPSQEEAEALSTQPLPPGQTAPAAPVDADTADALTEKPIISPVERAKEIARRRAAEQAAKTSPVTDPAPVVPPDTGATEPPTASVGDESAAPPAPEQDAGPVTEEVTEPAPNEDITANVPPEPPAPQKSELFDRAVEAVRGYNSASIGFLRGRLKISDAKARQLIFELEDAGIVSKPNERGIRTVVRDEVTSESSAPNEEITANVLPDSTFVPEAPETIEAQRQALVAGKKKAVMYSPDQPVPDLPGEGVVRGQFKVDGKAVVIDFNPKLTNYGKIQQAIRKNKLNELLDLGPANKQAVAESAAAGAAPVAVTERTPGGTEVKAAAGTVETAPEQVQALEETKTAPENTVAVEAPEQVIEERAASQVRRIDPGTLSDEERQRLTEASAPRPRVLQDQSPESQYARELTDEANEPVRKRVKQAAKEIAQGQVYEEATPKGKNRTKAEKQQREETNTRADQLFANTAPSEAERTTEFGFMDQNPVVRNKARAAIRERAKAIVTAARAAGLRLPAKVSDNTDEAMNLSDGAVGAVMARDFLAALKNPDPNKSVEEIYQDFLTDDMLLRNGQRNEVLGKRRSDNDTRTRADTESAVEKAESETRTPEQTVEAKEEGDEVAREALQRDFGPNYTAANKGTAGVTVETKKRRTIYKSEAGTSGGPTRELRPDDVLQEVTFAEAYEQATATPGTAINRSIIDGILNRLREKVGKVPVLVVNQSALDQMYGGVNQVDGYYDPQKGHIVVSENFLVGGEFDARLLAHEGLHSWLQEAINSNASLKKDIQQILDVAKARAAAKNQKFRGLKDIHEFISEAMSDPDFQNFLMATKLPPNLAAKYDMPQGSLWRSFLRVIQKYLGSTRDLNALDYAIRLTERADAIAEKRSQNLASVADLEDQMRQRGLLSEGRQRFTEAFKRWFRGSKAIAENGDPLVVYHGTMSDFSVFARDRLQSAAGDFEDSVVGFMFTSNPRGAGAFAMGDKRGVSGQIMPAFLSIQNPLVLDLSNADTVRIDGVPKYTQEAVMRAAEEVLGVKLTNSYGGTFKGAGEKMLAALREQGYDGVHVKNSSFGALTPAKERNVGGRVGAWDVWIALDEAQIKSTNNRGTFDPGSPDIMLSEGRQQNYREQLTAAGVPDDVATELGDYIQRELGNEIDPATLPLFMGDLIKEFAITSGGNAPPSGPTNTSLPGTPPPAAPMPSTPKGRATWLRGLSVKLNTLDYIRQKYNSYFGGRLDPYIKTIQKYENIVSNVSEKHDKDGAEFLELMRRDPKEATAMANLAMEATSLNVRLGPGADNSHLGKNVKANIQSRQRLAGLNARFDQLKPETRDLYKRMIANYRETHNDNIRALAYNLLVDMDLKNRLSNSDLMMLLDKTVNGTLTREDAAVIGEPKIYKELKRATSLRVIKGDYFPQMRFGDFVVLSKDKIADPRITFVTTKSNKRIPVKTTVTDNVVSFKIDSLARGGQAAMNRMIKDYIENSDLTLLRATKTIVDKRTGKTVKTGEMDLAKDYDISWNLEFQTRGVNFFESRRDAQKFRDELARSSGAQLDELSEVLDRREDGGQFDKIISGSALTEVTKRIDARKDIPTWQRKQMRAAVQEAIVSQMTGNRAQKRHMARRNVKGASRDIARAAITYGQAAGNYYATLTTAGDLRKSFSAIEEFEAQNASKEGGGVRSMVMNELRARHETMTDPLYLNKFVQNVAALSFFDKLVSPAYSIINFQQAIGNGLPYLGGKYGNARTAMAIAGAYRKIGTLETLASGAKNTATAVAQLRKSAIDTTDVVGSIRKKLGAKYEPLMDELIERGLVNPDSGFEIGQAIVDGSGPVNTGIAKFDRIARQLPNAVEAVNRTVVAVAAFDLATSRGKSVPEAVQEAYDAVANTQGDYRRSNNPRFMNNRFLSWALQFKKYAVLQTQLIGDMYARALKGASAEDRAVARKQLATMMAVQTLYAGALGLPGLELLKLGVALAAMLGFGDGWEEFEEEVKGLADEAVGETWSELLRKGVISRAIGIDVADRMSQADLWTGFMPPKLDREGMMQYAGSLLLGAPGSTLFDWFDAARELADGNVQKALEKAVPIKAVADTIRAVDQAQDGKMTAGEAVVKSIGFQPRRTANINEERSAEIRESRKITEERNKLRNEYVNATSKADIIRLRARIREFNRRMGKDGRKLSITTLEKYRRREMQRYRSE